ncbi:hypothetical protein AAMO2058_000017500 [Amorphochlora amoebiformis]
MEGYLKKAGRLNQAKYQPRYCMLDYGGRKLIYCEEDEMGLKRKGSVNLRGAEIISDETGKGTKIEIWTPARKYIFVASDRTEKSKWVEALRHCSQDVLVAHRKLLNFLCATWNVAQIDPQDPRLNLAEWLRPEEGERLPDVYCIALQEVVNLNEVRWSKVISIWGLKIESTTLSNGTKIGDTYRRAGAHQLVGILLFVYIKSKFTGRIHVKTDEKATGLKVLPGEPRGNKGAVAVRLRLFGVNFCIINSHLSAEKKRIKKRREDYENILKRIEPNVNKPYEAPDLTFWLGDLNYRYDIENFGEIFKLLAEEKIEDLLYWDQLTRERIAGNVFQGWKEGPIRFLPTYKYQQGTDYYDWREGQFRIPGWCDRILWKTIGESIAPSDVRQIYYTRAELRNSDHKPVSAYFSVSVKIPTVGLDTTKKDVSKQGYLLIKWKFCNEIHKRLCVLTRTKLEYYSADMKGEHALGAVRIDMIENATVSDLGELEITLHDATKLTFMYDSPYANFNKRQAEEWQFEIWKRVLEKGRSTSSYNPANSKPSSRPFHHISPPLDQASRFLGQKAPGLDMKPEGISHAISTTQSELQGGNPIILPKTRSPKRISTLTQTTIKTSPQRSRTRSPKSKVGVKSVKKTQFFRRPLKGDMFHAGKFEQGMSGGSDEIHFEENILLKMGPMMSSMPDLNTKGKAPGPPIERRRSDNRG